MNEYETLKNRRILILVENLPVPNDRRVWLEATALRDAGCVVSVISIKGVNASKSYECLENVHLYRYAAPPPTDSFLSFVWEFAYCWIMTFLLSIRVLFEQGFDVIHACNPPETFWLIGRIYKIFGKKFVFDHHDLSPEMYESRFQTRGPVYSILCLLEELTFNTADAVITTNNSHKAVAMKRGGIPSEKIFIVRSGPDHTILAPQPPEDELKLGHQYMVGYLGVMNPQDGVDTIIHVLYYLVHILDRNDILFVLMGSGDSLPHLRQLAQGLNLDAHIHFTGWAEQDMIRRTLSSSTIAVDTMPKTAYSDAATLNKILEYMAMGCPVISFDLRESRISAGEAAIFVKPGDIPKFAKTIVDLLGDGERRAHMSAYGRQRIETELAWKYQKMNLLAAYQSLFAMQSAEPPAKN